MWVLRSILSFTSLQARWRRWGSASHHSMGSWAFGQIVAFLVTCSIQAGQRMRCTLFEDGWSSVIYLMQSELEALLKHGLQNTLLESTLFVLDLHQSAVHHICTRIMSGKWCQSPILDSGYAIYPRLFRPWAESHSLINFRLKSPIPCSWRSTFTQNIIF